MADIRVPRLNANEDTCTLLEWLVVDGQRVAPGDPLAVVETAKAAEELASEAAGYVQRLVPAGADCRFGQVIARLFETEVLRLRAPAPPAHGQAGADATTATVTAGGGAGGGDGDGLVITAPARALIEEHGLDPAAVRALGRNVVRRADLEPLLHRDAEPEPDGVRMRLSRAQQAVAAVVTESHRSVPVGFAAVTATVDDTLAVARELSRQHHCLIGLPELVVKAVAAQHPSFPLCFAQPLDPATVRLSAAAHVGVTVDVGRGLRVPVVRDAGRLSWRKLATTMMEFRMAAIRGALRPGDLADGNILIALHTEGDVAFAVPLVFPGQVCAVSLAAPRTELALSPTGAVVTRQVVHLGLAYDHRVLNGNDAVAFLQAVKRTLGSATDLTALGLPPAGPGRSPTGSGRSPTGSGQDGPATAAPGAAGHNGDEPGRAGGDAAVRHAR
jgi:2-oxoglutarate dehydrogenase E2 component (dihydrolipoamide succinyltransferase)